VLFDKESFRGQQRDWQQILRTRCAKTCDPAAVEADYTRQRDTLRAFDEETWEASYKTADVATLTITHIAANQFDFAWRATATARSSASSRRMTARPVPSPRSPRP
jgi:hypothetical protein